MADFSSQTSSRVKGVGILSIDGIAQLGIVTPYDPTKHAGILSYHNGYLPVSPDDVVADDSIGPAWINVHGCNTHQIEMAVQANIHTHDPHPAIPGKFVKRGPIYLAAYDENMRPGSPTELDLDTVRKLYAKRFAHVTDEDLWVIAPGDSPPLMAGGATSGRIATTWNSGFLKLILGNNAAPSAPAGMYVGLDSATGSADNGTFTEITNGNSPGYARATISATNLDTAWTAVTNDATGTWRQNANSLSFPQATGGWTAVTGFRLWDASSAGTASYWGTFASASTVGSGATASFAANALKFTEA